MAILTSTPMTTLNYLDFDLQIDELAATSYRARVLNSPAGQAEATFDLPFSDLELENFFLRIGRPRRGVRKVNSPEMNEARRFGGKLYEAVFQGALQSCLLRSIDKAEQQHQGVRLRLRLPPSLVELPWEYLYDSTRQRFLSHSTSTPIVRYLDLQQSIKPLVVTPPLKVLVMITSPSDYEPLDVEAEWQKIKTAVAELEERGLVQLMRLPSGTLNALQKQLRREPFHIFHFIGHGGFDQQTQDGVLLLESEDGRSRLVSGNYLGTLLHDHPSLRLAVLNACEGARTAKSDPFAGVAQQLVRQGIPAVIAMQFEITDKAALQLAREFYDALADGYPVDGALAEARKAIFTDGNDIEWGTPVLYLRAQDGNFFDISRLKPVISQDAQVETTKEESPKVQPQASKVTPPVVEEPRHVATPATSEIKSTVQVEVPKIQQTAPKKQVSSKPAAPERPPIEFDWVPIPAGKFLMGSDKQKDANASDNELPQHQVYLSEYEIARVPVTNAQYKQFVEATNYRKPGHWQNGHMPQGQKNHPVIYVDWQDIQTFCYWAKVRLPTEAEWEKAARGSDGRIYPWGNEPPTEKRANYDSGGFFKLFQSKGTTPVGKYPQGASPYGVLDMAGNVWEWVADWYDPEYYKNSPTENPPGPTSGSFHVLKGGSWYNGARAVRSSVRLRRLNIDNRDDFVGFRVVRVVSPGG